MEMTEKKYWKPITKLEGTIHARDGETSGAEAVDREVREMKP